MSSVEQQIEQRKGIFYGVLAFVMWGLAPMYFKLLQLVPSLEILLHRIIWSFALTVVVVIAIKKWGQVRAVLTKPRIMLTLLASSLLLCANWGMFIWAVNSDRILAASLGYYINPLLNVLLGVVFLSEKLRRWQGVAVALAATGVMIQIISFGWVPWLSLALAGSFAIYGLIRKTIAVDSLTGLVIESCVMLPLAFGYWWFFADSSAANLIENSWSLNLLIIGTGVVTTLPLLCFTAGARRIKYTTMGFLQYIGPSMMFVQAILLYDEKVGIDRWVTFGFIWSALLVFSWDSMRTVKPKL